MPTSEKTTVTGERLPASQVRASSQAAISRILMIDMHPYDRGYRKIAMLDELALGEPKLYRTCGAAVLLLRSHFGVRAVDATGCVGVSDGAVDWSEGLQREPIPTETYEKEVWVWVDAIPK